MDRLISNFKYCREPGPVRHQTEPLTILNAVPQASEKRRYKIPPLHEPRLKNCEKINEVRARSAPKIYMFSNVFRRKNLDPRPPFKPGPPDICQVCQVEDPALQRATDPDFFPGPGKRRNVRIFSKLSN